MGCKCQTEDTHSTTANLPSINPASVQFTLSCQQVLNQNMLSTHVHFYYNKLIIVITIIIIIIITCHGAAQPSSAELYNILKIQQC